MLRKKSSVPIHLPQTGPVKGGSVLYMMIQMLAQAVASELTVPTARCKQTKATADMARSYQKPSTPRGIDE
jgi:hypothetical protein